MRLHSALLPLALGGVATALVLCFELTPTSGPRPSALGMTIDPMLVEGLLLVICSAVAAALGLRLIVRKRLLEKQWLTRAALVGLAAAMLVSGILYLYGSRGLARRHYAKWHDGFHYILGAKYFEEVGYLAFYDCVAQAHVENVSRKSQAASATWKVRDLRSYKMIEAREAIERTDCDELFNPARWLEFRADVALFHRYKSIPSVLRDHGYNGSPTHTFFAQKLANAIPLTYSSVTMLGLVDVVAISLMLALVALAFGGRLGFLFAILFFVNFSDRFYFIGGSMMRYVWMATLTGGIAMLRLGRYRTAGALMTTAALLNIFPVLFMVGIGVRFLWTTIKARRIARHYRHFIAASLITGALGLGLGASHSKGVSNYSEFLGFIGGHSQKLTSSRTGLRFTVIYRGQQTHEEPRVSYRKKAKELRRAIPFLVLLGGLMVAAGFVVCVRLDDVEASTLIGFLLFYVVFGTVEYYYACTPLLVLTFYRRWQRDQMGGALLASLFAMMAIVLLIWRKTQFLKFCNNTVMSGALLSFLSATLVYLCADAGLLSRLGKRGIAALFVAAALLGPAVVISARLLF